jgi:hypothetical protein
MHLTARISDGVSKSYTQRIGFNNVTYVCDEPKSNPLEFPEDLINKA